MFRALNDANGIAQALLALGTVECLLDNFYKGRACFAESLEWSRQTGNRLDEAAALACLGLFSKDKTNPLVYENFQAGLAIFRELGDLLDMTWVLRELANLDIYNGNFYAAQTRNTEAMEILHQLDLPDPERFAYETWGRLAYHQGD